MLAAFLVFCLLRPSTDGDGMGIRLFAAVLGAVEENGIGFRTLVLIFRRRVVVLSGRCCGWSCLRLCLRSLWVLGTRRLWWNLLHMRQFDVLALGPRLRVQVQRPIIVDLPDV